LEGRDSGSGLHSGTVEERKTRNPAPWRERNSREKEKYLWGKKNLRGKNKEKKQTSQNAAGGEGINVRSKEGRIREKGEVVQRKKKKKGVEKKAKKQDCRRNDALDAKERERRSQGKSYNIDRS